MTSELEGSFGAAQCLVCYTLLDGTNYVLSEIISVVLLISSSV